MKLSINKLLIGLLFVFSVALIPTVARADTFQVDSGYNSFLVTLELAFQSGGYSTSDPVGQDKYIYASGSFECIYNCWGTYLSARVNGMTGDVLLLAGDSAITYGGGALMNYYEYGGTTYTTPPVFYSPGWNTVTFTGSTEGQSFSYSMSFFYDPPAPPVPALTVTVKANEQSSLAVPYGNNSVRITWESTGATSCSESGGRGGTNTTGFFDITNMTATTTFNITCTTDSYSYSSCSGTYINSSGVTSSCINFTTSDACLFTTHCVWIATQIQCGQQTCVIGCKNNPSYPNYSNISCSGNNNTSCLSTTYPAYPNCTWNP